LEGRQKELVEALLFYSDARNFADASLKRLTGQSAYHRMSGSGTLQTIVNPYTPDGRSTSYNYAAISSTHILRGRQEGSGCLGPGTYPRA